MIVISYISLILRQIPSVWTHKERIEMIAGIELASIAVL